MSANAPGAAKQSGGWRRRSLGFHQRDMGRVLDDEIGLGPVTVAVKEQTAHFAPVGSVFHDLRDDPGFEDRAPQRMRAELLGVTDAKQPADQTRVVEVQFRHLHQPLAQIGVKSCQAEREKTGLENAEPSLGGRLGDAAVVCQRRVIDQLGRTAGAQLDEALEGGEISHVADGPHVPFDIGRNIRAEPVRRVQVSIEYPRIGAGEESLPETLWMPIETHDLIAAQRKQVVDCRPSGERLADRLQPGEVLRAGQNPTTGLRVGVDDALQVGKEVRDALHFVDDGPVGELSQKTSRVLRRKSADVRCLQGRVGMIRKQGSTESSLAALAWSGKRDGGELPSRPHQLRREVSLDHRR